MTHFDPRLVLEEELRFELFEAKQRILELESELPRLDREQTKTIEQLEAMTADRDSFKKLGENYLTASRKLLAELEEKRVGK